MPPQLSRRKPIALIAAVLLVAAACGGLLVKPQRLELSVVALPHRPLIPGDHIPLKVQLHNGTRDATAEGVSSAELTLAGGDLPASVGGLAPPLGPGERADFTVPVIVPLASVPGTARLQVCYNIDVACAQVPVTISIAADAETGDPYAVSPDMLIAEAVTARRLSNDEALLYRAYALAHDTRLPLPYQGGLPIDTEAFFDAFAGASSGTRATILPLLRPAYVLPAGSAPGDTGSARSAPPTEAAPQEGCNPDTASWTSYTAAGSPLKFWYPSAQPQDAAWAQSLSTWATSIAWPALGRTLQVSAPSDATSSCNGGDGRLDVVIWPLAPGVAGETLPADPASPHGCYGPAYVTLNSQLMPAAPWPSGREEFMDGQLTHELAHVFQRAFTFRTCSNWTWWLEGAADWAKHLLQPDQMHLPPCDYIATEPLDAVDLTATTVPAHQYTTWIYDDWYTRTHDPAFVRDVLKQAAASSSALDATRRLSVTDGETATAWEDLRRSCGTASHRSTTSSSGTEARALPNHSAAWSRCPAPEQSTTSSGWVT